MVLVDLDLRIEPWRLASWNAIDFSLHPGQARGFHQYIDHDFVWLCGGRRGGKSELSAGIAVSEFLKLKEDCKPGERWPKKILILAPEYKQARIIFGKVHRTIHRLGIPLKTDRFSAQEMEIESEWGALIMCMTGRNKDAWPGHDWDLVIVDEAPIFKDGLAFQELLWPTLLDAQGKFLSIGNPDYPGSFSHKWKLMGLDPNKPDWGYAHWTTIDNWFLPHAYEYIEARRRTTPEDIIRRQYFAEYVSKSGLVYPEHDRCIDAFDVSEGGRWHRAGDFGFRNPFVCLNVQQVGDRLDIIDEFYITEHNKAEIAPTLREMDRRFPYHQRKSFNVWDPEDPEGIDYFDKWKDKQGGGIKGVWVRNYSKGGLQDRIDLVRRMMASGLIRIHSRCTELIREYSMYSYPEKKEDKPVSEKPVDKDNHGIKALEYLTEFLFGDTFTMELESIKLSGRKRKSFEILRGYNV